MFGLLQDELLVQIFRWLDGGTLMEVVPAVCARWARAVVWTPVDLTLHVKKDWTLAQRRQAGRWRNVAAMEVDELCG